MKEPILRKNAGISMTICINVTLCGSDTIKLRRNIVDYNNVFIYQWFKLSTAINETGGLSHDRSQKILSTDNRLPISKYE